MRVLALGEKVVDDKLESMIRLQLGALSPSLVITDLAPGWNLLVAEKAKELSIPLLGAFPHGEILGKRVYKEARKGLLSYVNTKVVFNETFFLYLKNPKPYVEWLLNNTEVVFAYVDPDSSTLARSIMQVMNQRGKRVINVFSSHS